MKDITFCLMTCGEETEKRCLRAIAPFRNEIRFTEVRNVTPQIVALYQMLEQIETEYFVALDADMVLYPGAYARLRSALETHREDRSWHSILFPLWDTLTERRILALKLMRTRIMQENPFWEGPTPDVEHYHRLTRLGYSCVHDYLNEEPIGDHVVWGHHFCYHKFRDLYITYRTHEREWDAGAFLGGKDLREKSKNHFDFFLKKYTMTSKNDYLSCLAGMYDGITAPLTHESKNLGQKKYRIKRREAAALYMQWYVEGMTDTAFYLF